MISKLPSGVSICTLPGQVPSRPLPSPPEARLSWLALGRTPWRYGVVRGSMDSRGELVEEYGKTMEHMGNYRKNMKNYGKWWEIIGETWEHIRRIWETMGKIWGKKGNMENYGKLKDNYLYLKGFNFFNCQIRVLSGAPTAMGYAGIPDAMMNMTRLTLHRTSRLSSNVMLPAARCSSNCIAVCEVDARSNLNGRAGRENGCESTVSFCSTGLLRFHQIQKSPSWKTLVAFAHTQNDKVLGCPRRNLIEIGGIFSCS